MAHKNVEPWQITTGTLELMMIASEYIWDASWHYTMPSFKETLTL